MRNSELIKQLKSLKEEIETASRQAEMDKYVYERMQNIAGITNETEYVGEASSASEFEVGEIVGRLEQEYTDSGKGMVLKKYKIVRITSVKDTAGGDIPVYIANKEGDKTKTEYRFFPSEIQKLKKA